MKKAALVASFLALFAMSPMASAVTINFDDVDASSSFPAPGYQGFEWSGNYGAGSWVISGYNQFSGDNTVSGTKFAWSNGGTDLFLSVASGQFDFNSMWLRNSRYQRDVSVKGYLDGLELFSQVVNVDTNYTQATFNFVGIDRLIISNGNADNLLIDDIVVNQADVPEPASVGLLGLGLLAFAASRKKSLRK